METLTQMIFNKYGKALLTPDETAEVTGRSKAMLQKDRMDGIGLEYVKIGKGKNAKIYYEVTKLAESLQNNTIKTA